MATKIICDGCDADISPKYAPRDEDGIKRFAAKPGEPGDAISRGMTLRFGHMTTDVQSCPACMRRALEMLSTIFKVPVADLMETIGSRPERIAL